MINTTNQEKLFDLHASLVAGVIITGFTYRFGQK
jgi:hypothetical protein